MIDVHAAHGVQWPPFLQATCDRADSNLRAHLRRARSPAVATVAETEGTGGGNDDDDLPWRVAAAMDFYSVMLHALETTVRPGSAERLSMEQ
ncbi:hypothetical protein QYE76_026218 [Lolium multiflorum]|uniref:Uncharacterized protein n=1 Tax=Lolium multiflorum TaxID=4521 RepID=A0AAD8RH78_LOLMU|nr:hypothetical protein QYE76_026218 [Lolium multiflorum]